MQSLFSVWWSLSKSVRWPVVRHQIIDPLSTAIVQRSKLLHPNNEAPLENIFLRRRSRVAHQGGLVVVTQSTEVVLVGVAFQRPEAGLAVDGFRKVRDGPSVITAATSLAFLQLKRIFFHYIFFIDPRIETNKLPADSTLLSVQPGWNWPPFG